MANDAYLDIVGGVDHIWPPSYNAVIDRTCGRCHAKPYEMCINPISGQPAKAPCIIRGSAN
jgi:hypothetical protein